MTKSKNVHVSVRFTGKRGGRNERQIVDCLLHVSCGGIDITSDGRGPYHYARAVIPEMWVSLVQGQLSRRFYVTWPDGVPDGLRVTP
jgi:hypothetical protein